MRVEDEYFDGLQNLEWTIVSEYRQNRSILDQDARDAVNALVRQYEAESESRSAAALPLSDRAKRIFDAVRSTCEWRLGRAPAPNEAISAFDSKVTAAELVLCLKRIRKSIDFWNKRGGRQGYLEYVLDYVP